MRLNLTPDDAATNLARGETLFRLNNFNDAVVAFDKTLGLDPHNAHAAFGRGQALSAVGHDDEAVIAYEQALTLDSTLSDAA